MDTTKRPNLYRHVIRFRYLFGSFGKSNVERHKCHTLSDQLDAKRELANWTAQSNEILSVTTVEMTHVAGTIYTEKKIRFTRFTPATTEKEPADVLAI